MVITIIVLLILASVATYTGIEAIENTKRTKFIAELKIMQSYVNQWYDECKPGEGENWATKTSEKFTPTGAKLATDSNVSSQATIALSNMNTANVIRTESMFSSNRKLKTIYTTDLFEIKEGVTTNGMFYGCSVLEGGNGTKYSVAQVKDGSYAWIDGKIDTSLDIPAAKAGYFTRKPTV